MQKLFNLIILLILVTVADACHSKQEKGMSMVVYGKLDLPKGVFQLIESGDRGYVDNQVIDTLQSTDGSFNFKVFKKDRIGIYALQFIDESGIKYEIFFHTKRALNGGALNSQYFLYDDTIGIFGKLKPFIPRGFKLPDNLKWFTVIEPIKTGKQTEAMYNIDFDFSMFPTDESFELLKAKVEEFPDSYYLIHELNKYRSNFSSSQIKTLLPKFNEQIQQTPYFNELQKSIEVREHNTIAKINFEDSVGNAIKVDFSGSRVNIIILWASWCGPCRQEIPSLKKIFNKFGKDVQLVSISLDADRHEWLTALRNENMPWKQLLLPLKLKDNEKDLLNFDGAIPTTFLYDSKGLLLEKTTGYNSHLFEEFSDLIVKYLR